MQSKIRKILVLFVEPMFYGLDLIREVYEKTDFVYQYVYCYQSVTSRDTLSLPENAVVLDGDKKERKSKIKEIFDGFAPDFAIINGYVGLEQTQSIKYCQKHKIPYAIESDTPLHIPSSKMKAMLKKLYLKKLLGNKYCYAFPGGTLQKENFLYYGVPQEKCFIMPMSISGERLRLADAALPTKTELKQKFGLDGKKVFLFVGRLEHVKNVALLIEAFSMLAQTRDDVALCIVGEGSLKEELKTQAQGIEDVHFYGYVGFPANVEFYKMADVFVLPSLHEPWGLVINEAMTMGLPVIVSSKVGCNADLVKENENGFVFTDGNVMELFEKLDLASIADLSSFSACAMQTVQDWSYEYYLKCFLGAIRDGGIQVEP